MDPYFNSKLGTPKSSKIVFFNFKFSSSADPVKITILIILKHVVKFTDAFLIKHTYTITNNELDHKF